MAFREVRTYFKVSDEEAQRGRTQGVIMPFTFYMDAVMRGRFKAYSGPEVKGVNIVNLFLYDDDTFRNPGTLSPETSWHRMMNMYLRETVFAFDQLQGTREERIGILVDVFIQQAVQSPLPQMQVLVEHAKESKREILINGAIKRADEYLRALYARTSHRQ